VAEKKRLLPFLQTGGYSGNQGLLPDLQMEIHGLHYKIVGQE